MTAQTCQNCARELAPGLVICGGCGGTLEVAP